MGFVRLWGERGGFLRLWEEGRRVCEIVGRGVGL